MDRIATPNWRRYLVLSLVIFVAAAGTVWAVRDHIHPSNTLSFVCRSHDDPGKITFLRIAHHADGARDLVFGSGAVAEIFHVNSSQSGTYSASRDDASSGNSIYFNRQTGVLVETAAGSNAMRKILADRCNKKITAGMCMFRMRRILKRDIVDRDDCVAPAQSECETWKTQNDLAFELEFACTPIEVDAKSR